MTDPTADRIVKYGMPADDSERIVERHFAVALERRAFADAHFARAIAQGPKVAAALQRIKDRR